MALLGRPARPFDERYIPEPNSGCWLWDGAVHGNGYGWVIRQYRQLQAHRVSWIIHRGEIPQGMCVLHKCDTPICVNPDHLFLGTHNDNARDRVRKRRGGDLSGKNNSQAKLTEENVRAIRADARSQLAIAAAYGISQTNVGFIKRRITWQHVS